MFKKAGTGMWRACTIIILLLLSFSELSFSQTNHPKYVLGEIIVKLRGINAKFSPKLKSGILKTEVSSLDKLNEKFHIKEMGHVFQGLKEPQTFSYSKQKASYVSVPDLFPIFKVSFPKDMDVMQVVNAFQSDSNVEWAEPDYIYELKGLTPNDTLFANYQWALHNTGQTGGTPGADVHAPEAWGIQSTNNEVIVAVVDSGVDYNHPDLADNIWTNPNPGSSGFPNDVHGYDFCSNDNNPMDEDGHGTHVAGIIAAKTNNGTGVAGMNYKNTTKIMPVRALGTGCTPWTWNGGTASSTAVGIAYAADNGAKVINNSWGCKYESINIDSVGCAFSYMEQDAIDYADSKGAVVIFAAGNKSIEDVFYPQAYGKVIAVAATDHNDKKTSYSHYGTWVDISAPGGDGDGSFTDPKEICSTYPTSISTGYVCISGTSMAAPMSSGVAALIFSQHPTWTAAQVKAKLLSSTDPIDSLNTNTCNGASCAGKLGSGRLNAFKALFSAPNAPTNLTATSGNTQVTLSWTASTAGSYTVSGYNVYRSAISGSGYVKVNTSVVSATTYTNMGLTNGTTYYYVVRAVDSQSNESSNSSEVSSVPSAAPNAPNAPTGLTATAGVEQVTITWNPVVDASSYNLYMSSQLGLTKNNYATLTDGMKHMGVTSPYTHTGLTVGKMYYFLVTAVNGSGESAESFQVTAIPQPPVSAPSVPSGVSVIAGNGQVVISWSSVTDATSYNVYMASQSGVAKSNYTTLTDGMQHTGVTSPYNHTGLTNGKKYYFVVTALNSAGESAKSTEVSATPSASLVIPPFTPTGLIASAGNAQVTVSWTPVTGATSYNIYMASQPGVTKSNYATKTDGMQHVGVTSPYTHIGLVNGRKYYFVVTAVNAGGESAESAEVSAKPVLETIPPVITNVSASPVVTTAAFTWTTDEPSDSQVEYGTTTGYGSVTPLDINLVTAHSVILTNISQNTAYNFRVKSSDVWGNAAVSSNYTFTTKSKLSYSFPQGISLISIPLSVFSSPSPALIFGGEFMNFARWNAQEGAYYTYKTNQGSSNLNLTAGNAYWLKLSADKSIDVLGTPVSTSQNYEVAIYPGWNQIGNPFTQVYKWSDVSVKYNSQTKTLIDANAAKWVGLYAWSYPGQAFGYQLTHPDTKIGTSQYLQPFYGYWVYSGIQGTLVFLSSKLASSTAKLADDEKSVSSDGTLFSVQVKASTADAADGGNYFGVSKARSDDDIPKPPDSLEQKLNAYFVSGGKAKAADFRGSASQKEQVWDYVVECEGAQNVTLSWDVKTLPANAKLFMQDTASGQVVDMVKQSSASVSVNGKKELKIKYYKPDVLAENNGGASLFVSKPFTYPNPDKIGNATFRYLTSPSVVRVNIEVYNLAGKLIEKFDGNLNGESKWLFGDSVAAGVYFFRITAYTADNKESVVGKIVVVR